jgi:putative aldouronate transport system permease protein
MAKTAMAVKPKKKKNGIGQYILSLCLLIYTAYCALPLILVVISSFTDDTELKKDGFTYFPYKWSTAGMNAILRYGKQLGTSYMVTIFVTVVGTLLGLLVMSMFAYSLSRPQFRMRHFLSVYLLIPMLFNGGQLSSYIVFTSVYHLKNSLLLLILPIMVTTMNVIILRTYIANSIPEELMDAARIDGAGEYRTFFQITLPLMKPTLAAVGFMMATGYWNDWQNAYLYIESKSKQPLQLLLIKIQKSIEQLLSNKNIPAAVIAAMGGNIPQWSATMATALVVIGPVIIAYPFFQKYFVKGLTVGSVKG